MWKFYLSFLPIRIFEIVNILKIESPVVQLSAVKSVAHLHHPSVCRHVSLLQFVEHFLEQFLPKYPSIQAIG